MNKKIKLAARYKTKIFAVLIIAAVAGIMGAMACNGTQPATATNGPATAAAAAAQDTTSFIHPDTSTIPHDQFGDAVRYGRELIVNTAHYIGPHGTVGKYTGNLMACTNCHVDAGTRPFASNFISTHARSPMYRGRENKVLTLADRVNNCVERPCNGKPLPLEGKEMVAILSYMKWLSTNIPVGHRVKGDEGLPIDYPARMADTAKGAQIFAANCASCHGVNGQGQLNLDSTAYTYPPLWGPNSYQKGSSPHRVLKIARFVKANMPNKLATWDKPFLTDEQAVDVAAFINDDRIHPRPERKDKTIIEYPDYKMKPIDYDQGPYVDTFTALQHKFGPYQPIINYHKAHNLPVVF